MTHGSHTSLLDFGPHHAFGLPCGFSYRTPASLARGFPFRAYALHTCPHSSVLLQYRNLNLLSIGYDSRPRLRPRLTQGRSALPWKPWIFGLEDSHLHLATHSGILSSMHSTAPYGTASSRMQCSSTNSTCVQFLSFGVVFQPDRKSTRLNSSHNVASRMPSSA